MSKKEDLEQDENKYDNSIKENNPKERPPTDSTSVPAVSLAPPKPMFGFVLNINSVFGLSAILGAISVCTMFFIAAEECRQCFIHIDDSPTPASKECHKVVWVYTKNPGQEHLKEVFTVLGRFGYKQDPNETDWDLLWAHDYPFNQLYNQLSNLMPHQRVNHFPGSGYITNKVTMATSNLKYIPIAFKLPDDSKELLEYTKKYPNNSFVQKDNFHRQVRIVKVEDIDLKSKGSFVQLYVDNPLLISGRRFDIGIYTVITSVEPLRMYIYNGEALLRFCPEKYHPFDPKNLDKYVVGDDYKPIWEIPDLDYLYNTLGFNMKESLNAYLESIGENPTFVWTQIEDAIRTVVLDKEKYIVDVLKKYKSKRNFFELMRFDFVVDEELNIYLLEANMSPNLSSAHYPQNSLMYQQVLYNVLRLVGVAEPIVKNTLAYRSKSEEKMIVSDKDLAVYSETCNSQLCRRSCTSPLCSLCKTCLAADTRQYLMQAYKEHMHKGDCKEDISSIYD
ncbi:unnamed protein product [Acanthoscelides obtectus]|uniref:Uncharacterized protein n=3 Tax=Acanthoscelides obtectus TaxID=200917 RepID=A0A9P0LTD9_ACAOB|nr:unnamed protein product [Acanthoscelides obtectus]CAK1683265.1 Tubulin polyglutamylase TTLL4 [Acanthoscelides obtectus]